VGLLVRLESPKPLTRPDAAALLPVNELAMNLATHAVNDGYLQVLIVAETFIAEVLGKLLAMQDRFGIGVELNAYAVSHGNAVLHVEEECLHSHQPSV
jgi:hypothetical protein